MLVGDFISVKNSLSGLFQRNSSLKKFLKEKNINHYLLKCDLVEYNFKDIYKTFDISYLSKNNDLVGEQFADSQFLKDYESIEQIKDNLISVLIKRFKLRLSFMKNFNFSSDIFISEEYDFDPSKLHHSDYMIKIAIIKKDYDKWNNSNLNEYDYIFTLKENYDDLKKNHDCFVVDGVTVYEQIKNILNVLFRRKLEKFRYFINNVGFQKVFPKEQDYFKVLNSEYFNDEWYRNTYEISDNTDSVIHFLLVGFNKGNDPGPDFSTFEYYECNKDVEIEGLNPLVHYELYGRKENRIIRSSDIGKRNYSLVLNSPYFDAEWYRNTYELSDDIDLAEHYLKEGYLKSCNPGPDFSTFEYYECNNDVRNVWLNPLVHYELYGRREKRKIELPDDKRELYHSTILNSEYFNEEWYRKIYDIPDEDCASHYLNIGFVKRYDPGPDFSTNDYNECNKDVEDFGINPLLHYELYGKKEHRCVKLEDLMKRDYYLIFNSQFFDEKWYADTYGLSDDVDPVDHYLKEGYLKNYNPGPDFSTFEYYECNEDVKEWKMNPLVHYEFYGKNENRKIDLPYDKIQSYRSAIANSPYFDEEWYKGCYKLNGDVDAVEHYLTIGFALGYDPSPDFSTEDYYSANEDVEESGMNPLVHYELFGKIEDRKLKD